MRRGSRQHILHSLFLGRITLQHARQLYHLVTVGSNHRRRHVQDTLETEQQFRFSALRNYRMQLLSNLTNSLTVKQLPVAKLNNNDLAVGRSRDGGHGSDPVKRCSIAGS